MPVNQGSAGRLPRPVVLTMLKGMLVASSLIACRLARLGLLVVLSVAVMLNIVALNIVPSNALASNPVTQADDTLACPSHPPPACEATKLALLDAQSAVQAALGWRALWTTAEDGLKQARAAFLKGDYPAAARAARTAIEQAQLGIAQSQYPMFQMP
jgi:hypothetical protein